MDKEAQWIDLLKEAIQRPGIVSEAYSQFHKYSFGNVMWVALQCAARSIELGPIAGFNDWKKLGRKVISGKGSALGIWVPKFRWIENEEGEKPVDIPPQQRQRGRREAHGDLPHRAVRRQRPLTRVQQLRGEARRCPEL